MAVVKQARRYLAGAPLTAKGFSFEPDPIGFVRAAFWAAGIDLYDAQVAEDAKADGMAILFRSTSVRSELHRQLPRPGDLVFLDGRPRQTDLYPSGVAVVERVDGSGTVVAIGSFAKGPTRIALNLREPEAGGGRNDLLARDNAPALPAGVLFRSFADPF